MQLEPIPFRTVRWQDLKPESKPGESGSVSTRRTDLANVRVRRVDYSPGYVADHWCIKGHVLHVLSGQLLTELEDGRTFTLDAGMTYLVGDNAEPHRSTSPLGASLLIVD